MSGYTYRQPTVLILHEVRNVQPGIPAPTGNVSDLVCFLWVMILAAISAILALTNFMHHSRTSSLEVSPKKSNLQLDDHFMVQNEKASLLKDQKLPL